MGYAITFAARPIGGFLLGWIADNWGRKLSVNLSLGGMIIATVGQGLLPGKHFGAEFKTLGLVLLIITRALQGMSAGGEIGAISCYLVEISSIKTLGMSVCMISCGSQIAWAFASAFLAYLSEAIGPEAMLVWGWRIPFVICIFPGLLALWGRKRLQEDEPIDEDSGAARSDASTEAEAGESSSTSTSNTVQDEEPTGCLELITKYWPNLLIGFFGTVATATMWFVPPFWTLTAILEEHLGSSDALWVGNSAQLVGLAITPVAGWLTDKFGVAWTLLVGATFFTFTALPVYVILFQYPGTWTGYVGIGVFYGAAQGFSGAVIYLFVAELFPAKLRCQGIAASYNLAVSYIGGFGSLICTGLFDISPEIAPGAYFSATGLTTVITLLCALFLQRRGSVKLTHRRSTPYFGRSEPADLLAADGQKESGHVAQTKLSGEVEV